MSNWTEEKKNREEIFKQKERMQSLITLSEKENRDLTADEEAEFKRCHRAAEIANLNMSIGSDNTNNRIGRSDSIGKPYKDGDELRNTKILSNGQSVRSWMVSQYGEDETYKGLQLGGYLRALGSVRKLNLHPFLDNVG